MGCNLVAHIPLLEYPTFLDTSGSDWDIGGTQIYLDPSNYDGATYYFEIVSGSTSKTFALYDATNASEVATISTSGYSAGTRLRSSSFTPASGNNRYLLRQKGQTSASQLIYGARLVIAQSNATKTRLAIPLLSSNAQKSTETAYIAGTSGAYYTIQTTSSKFKYVAADWDYVDHIDFEIVGFRTGTGNIIVALNDDSDSSTIGEFTVSPASANIPTHGSNTVTLTNNKTYEVKLQSSVSGQTVRLSKAHLYITLTNLTKGESFFCFGGEGNASSDSVSQVRLLKNEASSFSGLTQYAEYNAYLLSAEDYPSGHVFIGTNGSSDTYSSFTKVDSSALNLNTTVARARTRTSEITLTNGDRIGWRCDYNTKFIYFQNSFLVNRFSGSLDATVTASPGSVTGSGLTANVTGVQIDGTVSSDIGTATSDGLTASVTGIKNVTISSAAGSASADGLTASIISENPNALISANVGSATGSGLEATILTDREAIVLAGLGAALAEGLLAAVVGSDPVDGTVTADAGSAAGSGLEADILAGIAGIVIANPGLAMSLGLDSYVIGIWHPVVGYVPHYSIIDKMNFRAMDSDFLAATVIDAYEAAIWTEKYNELGDFEIHGAISEQLLSLANESPYIFNSVTSSLMLVESVTAEYDEENGNTLTIKGSSFSKFLDRRLNLTSKTITGSDLTDSRISQIVCDLVAVAFERTPVNSKLANSTAHPERAWPMLQTENRTEPLSSNQKKLPSGVGIQLTMGDSLLKVVMDLCATFALGFKHEFSPEDNTLKFIVYEGVDRSNTIIFSDLYDNLLTGKDESTSENVKNVMLVVGNAKDGTTDQPKLPQIVTNNSDITGLARREVFFNAQIDDKIYVDENTTETMSDSEYIAALKQAGNAEICRKDYGARRFFEGDILEAKGFRYGDPNRGGNFELGDYVAFRAPHHIELSYARLVGITFSDSPEDGKTLAPEFGYVDNPVMVPKVDEAVFYAQFSSDYTGLEPMVVGKNGEFIFLVGWQHQTNHGSLQLRTSTDGIDWTIISPQVAYGASYRNLPSADTALHAKDGSMVIDSEGVVHMVYIEPRTSGNNVITTDIRDKEADSRLKYREFQNGILTASEAPLLGPDLSEHGYNIGWDSDEPLIGLDPEGNELIIFQGKPDPAHTAVSGIYYTKRTNGVFSNPVALESNPSFETRFLMTGSIGYFLMAHSPNSAYAARLKIIDGGTWQSTVTLANNTTHPNLRWVDVDAKVDPIDSSYVHSVWSAQDTANDYQNRVFYMGFKDGVRTRMVEIPIHTGIQASDLEVQFGANAIGFNQDGTMVVYYTVRKPDVYDDEWNVIAEYNPEVWRVISNDYGASWNSDAKLFVIDDHSSVSRIVTTHSIPNRTDRLWYFVADYYAGHRWFYHSQSR